MAKPSIEKIVITAKGISLSIPISLFIKISSTTGFIRKGIDDLAPAITSMHIIAKSSLNH